MPRKKAVTLSDLSRQLGLSVYTVSKALRGLPGMSEETRAAVVKAAAKLGYRTKDQERSLAVERIPIIPHQQRHFKFIISGQTGNSRMYQLLLEGLQEKLSEYGHLIETLVLPSGLNAPASFAAWTERHHLQFVDGVFLPPMLPPPYEKLLLGLDIPRVLLNFPPPSAETDSLAWDVGTAIHQSVRHLLDNGHRRILYVGSIHDHRGLALRWHSFVNAMRETGQEPVAAEHVTGRFALRDLWLREIAEKLPAMGATAILCAVGDNLAWIYHACSSLGLRIPDDCSLISLEHEALETMPELSRPILLIRETGVRAAERMLWRLANPGLPFEHILLQGGFFKGKTVLPRKEDEARRRR
ncbi:LacI family DNA-binding transcriptional regulator [Paenibacillus hodogayensis]|uniref:LacI family DNA-binding transcriptional regulator n=1 Tax=Paenibacillus hodogayensis TaxID=279208 RepID=A0ABV5VZ79_9BACL